MGKARILFVCLSVAWFLTSCKSKVGEKPKRSEHETEEKKSPDVQASSQDAMLNEPLAREFVPEKLRDTATMVCKTCGWHVKADVESCPHCEAGGEFKREKAFYPEFFRPWKWCLLLNGDEVWASGWGGISVYSLKEMREVRRITEDDGLHSSFLGFSTLCKDDDGSIWLSGGGIPESGIFGLSRWDGDEWIPYTADVGLTPRNIGTYGLVVTWDSVWSGGPGAGLIRIRPRWTEKTKGDPWRRYWTGNFDLISCDNVMDIIVDRDDPTTLWLAHYDSPEGGDIGGKWRRPQAFRHSELTA